MTPEGFAFAVRIINIPDHGASQTITARPYYIYDMDGKELTVYGQPIADSYTNVDSVRTRMRVLTIGDDSDYGYTRDYLFDVLKSAGYDQVILGNLSLDGDHYNALKNGQTNFTYYKNDDNSTWNTYENVSGLDVFREEKWDAVVIHTPNATDEELTGMVGWVQNNLWSSQSRVLVTDRSAPTIDGVVAIDTTIKNLATVLKGDALTDAHRNFAVTLAYYLGATGETLDLITYIPSEVRDQYFNRGRAAAHATADPEKVIDLTETLLLAGSDYQPGNWKDGPPIVEGLLSSVMSDGTSLFDGFFCGGDYAAMAGLDVSTTGITALDGIMSNVVYGNKLYVEGNHDDPAVELIDEYGPNDPIGGTYGAFVINEEHYGAYGSNGTKAAADLTAYLNEKIGNKSWGNKPIFVLSHVPLHYSRRTAEEGCAAGATALINALNKGGEAGLNIIFLFAHNHGSGHDDHLGGGSVYLKKGDNMLTCSTGNMNAAPSNVKLKFTYMNYGYINNYADHGFHADTTLTMTTFRIRADGAVIITRYDKNGVHNLKSAGVVNAMDGQYVVVNTTVYESSRIVTATSDQPYQE